MVPVKQNQAKTHSWRIGSPTSGRVSNTHGTPSFSSFIHTRKRMSPVSLTRSCRPITWLVFVALSLLVACSGNQAASEPPPTPEPETQQPATPQPTSTAVPATATPEPTPTATPVPTVAPPPTTTATGVSFQPVTPGVGPYDYPDIGLDQVTSNPVADAVWTVVELHNATAQMAQAGSAEAIPSWDNLAGLGRVAPDYVANVETADWASVATTTGNRSSLTELAISTDDGLIVSMCAHLELVEDGDPRDLTLILEHRFANVDAKFQLYSYKQTPIDPEEFVTCEL